MIIFKYKVIFCACNLLKNLELVTDGNNSDRYINTWYILEPSSVIYYLFFLSLIVKFNPTKILALGSIGQFTTEEHTDIKQILLLFSLSPL